MSFFIVRALVRQCLMQARHKMHLLWSTDALCSKLMAPTGGSLFVRIPFIGAHGCLGGLFLIIMSLSSPRHSARSDFLQPKRADNDLSSTLHSWTNLVCSSLRADDAILPHQLRADDLTRVVGTASDLELPSRDDAPNLVQCDNLPINYHRDLAPEMRSRKCFRSFHVFARQ